jgi:hypothetical protein
MRGIDILKGIVEEAYELCRVYPDFPDYEEKSMHDFMDFYNDLHRVSLPDNDVDALKGRINWAARFNYFNRLGIKYGEFDATDPKQLSYDLVWDRIGDKDIARKVLSKLGSTALTVPIPEPPATRARNRVKLAAHLYRHGKLGSVNWYKLTSTEGEEFRLGPPLNTQEIALPEL